MKFNKKDITNSVLCRFFLLALFVLVFATQTVQAEEMNMDKLDFLQSQANVIRKVEMPINIISENRMHYSRPLDAVLASFARDAVKNELESRNQIDVLRKESEGKIFTLGNKAEMLGRVDALASKHKNKMGAINDFYEVVVDKYTEEAKFAIEKNIANAYTIADRERTSDLLERTKLSIDQFGASKPIAGDFASKHLTQLRTKIDTTYAGMLTGAITLASIHSRSNMYGM